MHFAYWKADWKAILNCDGVSCETPEEQAGFMSFFGAVNYFQFRDYFPCECLGRKRWRLMDLDSCLKLTGETTQTFEGRSAASQSILEDIE